MTETRPSSRTSLVPLVLQELPEDDTTFLDEGA